MATCPSNSTDCLLRAILSTQDKYDWNPPTFGATVVVGILALLISITTVFQAALGAGPGRLKASKRAIGPFYSQKTRTQFSFTELRFRTVAWVPLINQVEWAMTQRPPNTAQRHSSGFIAKPIKSICGAAGWLNLIQAIPIESRKWFTTPCQTDYLPADVLAAPARATVRAIVELAVLGGCDSVQIVNDLPLVGGRVTQLSFREHPSLGSIAVFDHFPLDMQMNSEALQKRDVLYLQGQMSFQGIFTEALLFDGKSTSKMSTQSVSVIEALNARRKCEPKGPDLKMIEYWLNPCTEVSLVLGLLTWDSLSNCRGLPYSKIYFRGALLSLLRTNQTWNSMEKPTILRSIYHLLSAHSQVLAYDTSVPYDSGLSDEQCSKMLGWTWLFDQVTGSLSDPSYIDTLPKERLSEGKSPWFEWRPNGMIVKGSSTLASGDGNLLVLPSALDICLNWLEDASALREVTANEKDEARSALQYQLHEVDFWLLNHGGARSADCVFQLLELPFGGSYFAGQRHRPWGGERQGLNPKALTNAFGNGPGLGADSLARRPPGTSRPLRAGFEISRVHRGRRKETISGESPRSGNTDKEGLVLPDEIWTPQSPKSLSPRRHPLRLLPAPEGTDKEAEYPKVIPPGARWTRIDRRLVNPEALELKGIPFEESPNHVVALRVLTRDEIEDLARITLEVRKARNLKHLSMQQERRDEIRSVGPSSSMGKEKDSSHKLSEHGGEKPREDPTQSEGPSLITHQAYTTKSRPASPRHSITSSDETESDEDSGIDEERAARTTLDDSLRLESPQVPDHPLVSKHGNESVFPPSGEEIMPPKDSHSSDSTEADDGMKTLLIYRAVLFAALGALAADTSCVFGTELGRRVVQVL